MFAAITLLGNEYMLVLAELYTGLTFCVRVIYLLFHAYVKYTYVSFHEYVIFVCSACYMLGGAYVMSRFVRTL